MTERPVVIISCTDAKADQAAPAADLYQGRNFGHSLAAALAETDQDADRVFILSARHGLVRLDQVLAPYDETLATTDRDALVELVAEQTLTNGLQDRTDVYAMVPDAYFEVLVEGMGFLGTFPTKVFEDSRGVGDQRHVMSHSIAAAAADDDASENLIERLYHQEDER